MKSFAVLPFFPDKFAGNLHFDEIKTLIKLIQNPNYFGNEVLVVSKRVGSISKLKKRAGEQGNL